MSARKVEWRIMVSVIQKSDNPVSSTDQEDCIQKFTRKEKQKDWAEKQETHREDIVLIFRVLKHVRSFLI